MAENSHIAWCEHSFNPWIGCVKVSPGCKNCYAEVDTFARRERSHGRELWGPQAGRHRTSAEYWRKPLAWNKHQWWQCDICGRRWREDYWQDICLHNAVDDYDHASQVRQRVFCASMADVFEDREELVPWRMELFALIEATPNLDWLLLTKRPENVLKSVPMLWYGGFPRNVWMGVSVENQKSANVRIPLLQKIPAAVKFLSCEPLLEYVDLSLAVEPDDDAWSEVNAGLDDDDEPEEFIEECEAECDWINYGHDLVDNPAHAEWVERRRMQAGFKTLKDYSVLDWVICGGESGPHRREMQVHWAEQLYAECQQAGIPFFIKQDSGAKPGQQGRISDALWMVKEFPSSEESHE